MPFRRVPATEAGPQALGILVPPGRATLLIVRPRGLNLDLVAARSPGEADFWQLTRAEASGLALRLYNALTLATLLPRTRGVAGALWGEFHIGEFYLVLCSRVPGEPYTPKRFADPEPLLADLASLGEVLAPGELDQEVYFNTTHFARE